MRIFETANYNLIPNRKKGYVVSSILLVLSAIALIYPGLELGIDFKGGMEFVVESEMDLESTAVRSALEPVLGSAPEVKTFGADGLLVRTLADADITERQNAILGGIGEAFPGSDPVIVKSDVISARFSTDLARGAIYSVFFSLFVIFIYILVRFGGLNNISFSVGAVAALFHDVFIVLGIFAALHNVLPFSLQIDQAIIAAFLTIIGYSLNDTVVIFDRIREFTAIFKTEEYSKVVNRSINATLSRTVVTSVTTLIVVLILFILGGEVLRGFAFALCIGVVIGTYSSIFVASPILVEIEERRRAAKKKAVKTARA
jgi:preprotein translocase SecF subunit